MNRRDAEDAEIPGVAMLLSRGYEPDRRVQKEAHTLAAAGYRVTVIAWDREGCYPAHEIDQAPALLAEALIRLPLLRLPLPLTPSPHAERGEDPPLQEPERGQTAPWPVSIVRVRVPAGYGTGRSLLAKMPLFWWRALHELRRIRPAVVHAHDLDTLPLAYLYGRLAGVPVIFDAHEFYPGMVRKNVGSLLSRALDMIERILVPRVDAVITVGERLADHYRTLGAQVWIVHNSQPLPDLDQLNRAGQAKRRALGVPDDALLVVHVGLLNHDRLIMPLVEAVSRLDNVWLMIGGTGDQRETIQAAAQSSQHIHLLGWIAPEDVQILVRAGDIVYYGLNADNANSVYFMPNLGFHALSAGRPLLVTPVGEIAEVVRATGCGIVMETATAEAAQQALERLGNPALRVTLEQQARYICQEQYNWTYAAARLLAVYRHISNACTIWD